ncbi:unnamed protein product [Rotaria socialis]|uniref:Reverse transcriptase Ty1/copia-type domain-containing protein n=1 Tax=Rotaria socialis TaxID=392032 RepID=A0A821VVZ9_9BILA|nr:unnamed protein product [Rotaria socialis]
MAVEGGIIDEKITFGALNSSYSNLPLVEEMKRLVEARNDNEHQDLVRPEKGFEVRPSVIDNIPKSSKEISQTNDKEKWISAINEELSAIASFDVYDVVPRPEKGKVLTNRWVLTIKKSSNGVIERYKVRLVVREFEEITDNSWNFYSPTLAKTVFRIFFVIVASKNLKMKQLDVKNAFLNGTLPNTVYVELPEFSNMNESIGIYDPVW